MSPFKISHFSSAQTFQSDTVSVVNMNWISFSDTRASSTSPTAGASVW